jgi:hypothetical protein
VGNAGIACIPTYSVKIQDLGLWVGCKAHTGATQGREMQTKQESALIWVCICCMLIHANGECGEDCHDKEPWSAIGEEFEITMGLLAAEHADDCPVKITGDWQAVEECDCAINTFSHSSCDGCGSPLAGERHAFTIWWEQAKD